MGDRRSRTVQIMAAVMCAGMVPPLALALATVLRPGLFTEPERENGKAAWLLGASFISRCHPVRRGRPVPRHPVDDGRRRTVGALIMAFGVELRAPHGGIFVFFAMNNWVLFLVALVAGTVLSAVAVTAASNSAGPGRWQRPTSRPWQPDPRPTHTRRFHPARQPNTPATQEAPCPAPPPPSDRPSACTPGRPRSSPRPSPTPARTVTLELEGGDQVDAGSALMIMTLGAEKGAKVVVTAEDQAALDKIVTLVETDLDAD